MGLDPYSSLDTELWSSEVPPWGRLRLGQLSRLPSSLVLQSLSPGCRPGHSSTGQTVRHMGAQRRGRQEGKQLAPEREPPAIFPALTAGPLPPQGRANPRVKAGGDSAFRDANCPGRGLEDMTHPGGCSGCTHPTLMAPLPQRLGVPDA